MASSPSSPPTTMRPRCRGGRGPHAWRSSRSLSSLDVPAPQPARARESRPLRHGGERLAAAAAAVGAHPRVADSTSASTSSMTPSTAVSTLGLSMTGTPRLAGPSHEVVLDAPDPRAGRRGTSRTAAGLPRRRRATRSGWRAPRRPRSPAGSGRRQLRGSTSRSSRERGGRPRARASSPPRSPG